MDHFTYSDQGILLCDGVPAEAIADAVGTPTYVYAASTLRHHVAVLTAAFQELRAEVHFAVKSLNNLHVLRLLVDHGCGLDVVSGGELERAVRVACPMQRVGFAGVGKCRDEIRKALTLGVAHLNAESISEIEMIESQARDLGLRAGVCVRVNPDVDARTHRYTTTGLDENKFGVDPETAAAAFARFGHSPYLDMHGLHCHLGSPIFTTEPYVAAIARLLDLADRLGGAVRVLNIGGGFGADYMTGRTPSADTYARAIVPMLAPRVRGGLRVIIEPGRFIAANAGVLLTRLRRLKPGRARSFAVCDAGMTALIRPALYEAFHFIWPARCAGFVPPRREEHPALPGLAEVDIVGPVCESGDFLAQQRLLPPLAPDAILAVFTAGAYGMTMSSTYNDQPRPAEVLVDAGHYRLIRPRQTIDDLLDAESVR